MLPKLQGSITQEQDWIADNAELGGVVCSPHGCAALQKDLVRLEKWADRTVVKFNKGKIQVLHQMWNNPMHHYRLETKSTEKELVVLVDTKLHMREQCALAAKKVNSLLVYIRQSIDRRTKHQHWFCTTVNRLPCMLLNT